MAPSSQHMLVLFGALALAAPQAAPAPPPPPGPGFSGFVVLHFMPAACQGNVKSTKRAQSLFKPVRRADGELLAINGHVALRFKSTTSDRQIDSLIAATGVEVFPSASRSGCRRYVISVANLEDDAITVATKLQQTGLVDYATPDLSAGRPEGIPSDSFYVDPAELTKSMSKTASVVEAAPTTYGMGQVLSAYTGPVTRISKAEMTAVMSMTGSSMSALDLVRSHGITTLHLEIPERTSAAPVRIMLYTLTGTPVRELVSETLDPGQYLVGWDGTDDRGRRVQPGVYVAVMTAENFHETRRLVVR